MITWYYDKYGNVSLWRGAIKDPTNEFASDVYLQNEEDVKSFFNSIGKSVDFIRVGDWCICKDVGYFN